MAEEKRTHECKIRNKPKVWTIIGCVIGLIVCIAMLVNIFGPLGDGHGLSLVDVQDSSHAPQYYGARYSINAGSAFGGEDACRTIAVTARLAEALPDT